LFIFQLVPIQKGEWVMIMSLIGCANLALLSAVPEWIAGSSCPRRGAQVKTAGTFRRPAG
jgi:hypothetical protein